MVAQQPQATGTLGGTPVLNLLVYALDRELTGTLVIEDHRNLKSAIRLVVGAPVKVKLPEPAALLSEILVGMGAIDAAVAAATWQTAEGARRLHGDVLVEEGFVERDVVTEALAEQVARKVEWLCSLRPESLYGYYDGQDFLKGYGGAEARVIDPLAVIWRTVRLSSDPAQVNATLSRLGDRDVRLHLHSRVARFGFTARERGVVDLLRAKPQSVPKLVASELLPELQTKKILYALVVTRHLDLGGATPVGIGGVAGPEVAPAPAVAAVNPPAPAANVPSPAQPTAGTALKATVPRPPEAALLASTRQTEGLEAFRKEIQERNQTMGAQNYYQILGIDPGAPSTVVQSVFFQLAKRWHPDRFPGELSDLRDLSIRVFARMSEAHQVLSNDEQRQEYDRLMREGSASSDDQEVVQKVLRAATSFQKAEVLLRRGNADEAVKQAALAVEGDPEQAEYLALYADLLSQAPERQQSGNYADVLKMVNEARKREPENIRVRNYRARVLKRSGDAAGAHKEYRSIVEQDARHVEAAREVRLYEMRNGKSTTDPSRATPRGVKSDGKNKRDGDIGQIFGKLFKR